MAGRKPPGKPKVNSAWQKKMSGLKKVRNALKPVNLPIKKKVKPRTKKK